MKKLLLAAVAVLSLGSAVHAGGFNCTRDYWGNYACWPNTIGLQINRNPSHGQAGAALADMTVMLYQLARQRAYERQLAEQQMQAPRLAYFPPAPVTVPKPLKRLKKVSRKHTPRSMSAEDKYCADSLNSESSRCYRHRQLTRY